MSHRAASLGAAPRRPMDQARADTGYDRVIESMIATFSTFAPGG
jgi:hypothetical protein